MGSQTGTLTVSDALRTQTVALTGTGIAPPALSVNPSSLSFSTQQPGVASAPQTVTVSNTGGAAMANVGFQITGPAAASYSIGATTCGATLNGGGSCTVQVVFTPAATGAIDGRADGLFFDLGVAPVSVSLNGSGLLSGGLDGKSGAAELSDRGSRSNQRRTAGDDQQHQQLPIGPLAVAVSGPFALSQNTCQAAWPPGQAAPRP